MDESPVQESLNERVARLERRLKFHRLGSFTILVVAGAVLLSGARQAPRAIEADRFVVRDAAGQIRATLGMFDGNPQLWFLDGGGKQRLVAGLNSRPPDFFADTPQEHRDLMKAAIAKGESWAGFGLYDAQGKGNAVLNSMPWGGEMILYKEDKPAFRAPPK